MKTKHEPIIPMTNLSQSYQIMDRIGYVKRMISTHQKKLITEPKRSTSQLDTSQQTDLIKRTRDSTSASDYQSANDNVADKKLLREELKITRSLLNKRTQEYNQLQCDQKDKLQILNKLEQENDTISHQLKKLKRENDDLQEELMYKNKKIDTLKDEIQRLDNNNKQMLIDLQEARKFVQEIKQFENELKQKEKQLLLDWQKLEKERACVREKQSQLLNAEEQLSFEAQQLQVLKNRINIQEKKLLETQKDCQNSFKAKEQTLGFKEKALEYKELSYFTQNVEREDAEKKERLLEINDELWKKKVQMEFNKIKEVQQKLKIIK